MEEYIVDVSPLAELYEKAGHERHPFTQIANCPINGRIVRCKDCRNMVPAGYVSLGSNSAWHESCLKLSSWDSEHDWMEWFYTEPDCFCAWGEPRAYHGPTITGETEEDKQP